MPHLLTRSLSLIVAVLVVASCDSRWLTGSGSAGSVGVEIPRFATQGTFAAQLNTNVGRVNVSIVSVGTGATVLQRDYQERDIEGRTDVGPVVGTLTVTFPMTDEALSGPLELIVEIYNTDGVLLFRMGPTQFTLGADGRATNVDVIATYVGPGSEVTGVRLEPLGGLTLVQGETGQVTCFGIPGDVTNFPFFIESNNQGIAQVSGSTVLGVAPGQTEIRCQHEFSSASGQIPVTVTARPTSLTVVSGAAQTAPAGSPLPLPVRFEVRGTSNQALAGIRVQIQVTVGGGLVSVNEVTTASDGTAQVLWTLGSVVGTQTIRIVVPGTTLEQLVNATATQPANGAITGTVTNRVDGAALAGAMVELRSGGQQGTLVGATSADLQGGFQFTGLPVGNYTVIGRRAGFLDGSTTAAVANGQATIANLLLDPVIGANEIVIDLNWPGAVDLDAHLQLPSQVVVFWENLGSCLGPPFACLENDDFSTGIRPERVRISMQQPGTYSFFVHNFDADEADLPPSDLSLAQSGATVTVRRGQTNVIFTANVPNAPGNLWHVFNLSGTVLTPVNTIAHVDFYSPSEAPPGQLRADGLAGKAGTKRR